MPLERPLQFILWTRIRGDRICCSRFIWPVASASENAGIPKQSKMQQKVTKVYEIY